MSRICPEEEGQRERQRCQGVHWHLRRVVESETVPKLRNGKYTLWLECLILRVAVYFCNKCISLFPLRTCLLSTALPPLSVVPFLHGFSYLRSAGILKHSMENSSSKELPSFKCFEERDEVSCSPASSCPDRLMSLSKGSMRHALPTHQPLTHLGCKVNWRYHSAVFNWPVTYSMVAPKHKSGDAVNSDLIRIPFTEFIWQYSNDSISLSIANLLLNLI